jgi:hypothetical protein
MHSLTIQFAVCMTSPSLTWAHILTGLPIDKEEILGRKKLRKTGEGTQ